MKRLRSVPGLHPPAVTGTGQASPAPAGRLPTPRAPRELLGSQQHRTELDRSQRALADAQHRDVAIEPHFAVEVALEVVVLLQPVALLHRRPLQAAWEDPRRGMVERVHQLEGRRLEHGVPEHRVLDVGALRLAGPAVRPSSNRKAAVVGVLELVVLARIGCA
ncbi:hypothetical protein [Rubrivivax rivuli]|uniref:Uncharacterized protein n=1 Tax=Rubrivivax rivuli TaxID=1862385 RepID=A0A437RAV1_9BURK|nr:hypothetical protein [Rubrivivax rivuli]RVU43842.1 hypothetical protein EOE66_19465 [Rubrivivax rivuli]